MSSGALTSAEPPEAARPTFLRGLDQLISGDVDEACLLQQNVLEFQRHPCGC